MVPKPSKFAALRAWGVAPRLDWHPPCPQGFFFVKKNAVFSDIFCRVFDFFWNISLWRCPGLAHRSKESDFTQKMPHDGPHVTQKKQTLPKQCLMMALMLLKRIRLYQKNASRRPSCCSEVHQAENQESLRLSRTIWINITKKVLPRRAPQGHFLRIWRGPVVSIVPDMVLIGHIYPFGAAPGSHIAQKNQTLPKKCLMMALMLLMWIPRFYMGAAEYLDFTWDTPLRKCH